ncbi:hypothetical protein [Pseudomonas typographi]|uniref:hypothetical protein n=1 Tax=Pseudomonas typographi TaxID=2715964 RepID=UPI001688C017|nr:hypothetical protein [Pseudomonas typographi]MBD1589762.1 hypothetical protein [Pseudomonas typographi]
MKKLNHTDGAYIHRGSGLTLNPWTRPQAHANLVYEVASAVATMTLPNTLPILIPIQT